VRRRHPVCFYADVALHQEEAEETIGNGLKGEAHKDDLLPRVHHLLRRLKATSASLLKGRFRKYP
jgi:hypothetical protein